MSVTIRMNGSKALSAAIKDMSLDVQQEVSKAVVGTAIEMRKDVVKSIQSGPASGTMYYRIYDPETGYTTIYAGDSEGFVVAIKGQMNLSQTHRASAAGEAPMSDTGRLASSIEFDKRGRFTATVGSNLVYAEWLEYGTLTMAARPFFRPAVERMRPKFRDRLEKAVRRATQ